MTDRNVLELSKMFVLLACWSEPPGYSDEGDPVFPDSTDRIIFLDVKRTNTAIGGITWNARLNVKFNEQVEAWHFARWHDGLGIVSRRTEAGQFIKQYDLPEPEPPPKR